MRRNTERELSLVGHLAELRTRLIIVILALVIATLVSFTFAKPFLRILTYPIHGLEREPSRTEVLKFVVSGPDNQITLDPPDAWRDLDKLAREGFQIVWPADPEQGRPEPVVFNFGRQATQSFVYLRPLDPIMIQLNVALFMGIVLALPIILWQIWAFVCPGLTIRERRIVKPMLSGALALFPTGAVCAFFLMSLLLRIMQMYQPENIEPMLNIFPYLSLLITMMVVFGVLFEIPLAIAIGARVGLINPAWLSKYRPHAYVVMSILAMILTPADPFTMLIAYIPLIILFELSIGLAKPMAMLYRRESSSNSGEAEAEK